MEVKDVKVGDYVYVDIMDGGEHCKVLALPFLKKTGWLFFKRFEHFLFVEEQWGHQYKIIVPLRKVYKLEGMKKERIKTVEVKNKDYRK